MAKNPDDITPLIAEVISMKGDCSAGHKVGDRLSISPWDSGGLCGFFYHDMYPALTMMQFGGRYPWQSGDEIIVECPDRQVAVTMKLLKG
jgi:uncharacterized repeat protein (TIGR04076 family)